MARAPSLTTTRILQKCNASLPGVFVPQVGFVGFTTTPHFAIILEFMGRGSVFGLMRDKKRTTGFMSN